MFKNDDDVYYKLACPPISEVYTEWREDDDDDFYAPSDYGPMLASLGADIVLKVDDADYSGDSRVILHRDGHYGLLIFGWGSCSGCDALQSCNSMEEVEALRFDLYRSIYWGTTQELHDFMRDRDWEVEFSYHKIETRRFVKQAIELLASRI